MAPSTNAGLRLYTDERDTFASRSSYCAPKPDSVPSLRRWAVIYLGLLLPATSSGTFVLPRVQTNTTLHRSKDFAVSIMRYRMHHPLARSLRLSARASLLAPLASLRAGVTRYPAPFDFSQGCVRTFLPRMPYGTPERLPCADLYYTITCALCESAAESREKGVNHWRAVMRIEAHKAIVILLLVAILGHGIARRQQSRVVLLEPIVVEVEEPRSRRADVFLLELMAQSKRSGLMRARACESLLRATRSVVDDIRRIAADAETQQRTAALERQEAAINGYLAHFHCRLGI